ncbi:hypothetical protein CJO78_06075 [Ralstonia solanacearum]|nr:hypothetical protein CJO78_06075 [Ralstonia solanacearum]AXW05414.1 hypothetical protein CJO82_05850 [Ralstonia solanacearum]AXW23155.1 hypothetical protein CJO86_05855 [Ralstonia solanacearum]AXW80087.1 hypothetical protein CJO98_06085 [Ralstonia solanacearum]
MFPDFPVWCQEFIGPRLHRSQPTRGWCRQRLPVMKLLLLGATGRTGRLVLEYALDQGHEVTALVRNPGNVTTQSSRQRVVAGTPERFEDVARAIVDCEAVIVALNNSRTSDNPWARPASPPHLMEHAVRNSLKAMKENRIRRIVILSASGVGDSFQHERWFNRLLVKHSNLGIAFADHNAVDACLRETRDIDWTAVRPVLLSNAEKRKTLVVSYDGMPKPAMTISRRYVAKFMVDSLSNPAVFARTPVISET